MGARSTGSHPTTTKADGHLLEYFRQTFGAGGGGTNASFNETGLTATGGIISEYTSGTDVYRAHVFMSSGALNVTDLGNLGNNVDYLCVAGGGGNQTSPQGSNRESGSGAGGLLSSHPDVPATFKQTQATISSTGNINIVVGGGAGGKVQGSPSSIAFSSPVSTVGGGHGANQDGQVGGPGGSGGGNWYSSSTPGQATNYPGPTQQGYPGGTQGGTNNWTGGAGGGAGAQGANDGSSYSAGRTISITGSAVEYSRGGKSNSYPSTPRSENGISNTGGGASGVGNGGSGIVVVRYKIAEITATAKATGGAISFYETGGVMKTIHAFTGSGTFANPTALNGGSSNPLAVEYVVVAGGGGGGGTDGNNSTGGAGAGGYLTGSSTVASASSFAITVGGGGRGGLNSIGNQGNNSVATLPAGTITSTGGGAGSWYSAAGGNGGSGGGGGGYTPSAKGTGSSGQGKDGGVGNGASALDGRNSGGGGGAGAAGQGGSSTGGGGGGDGGVGVQVPTTFRNPQIAPSNTSNPEPSQRGGGLGTPGPAGSFYLAGGGGGAGGQGTSSSTVGVGGAGGGGAGRHAANTGSGTPGLMSTGGGAGGGHNNASLLGGQGGSGIVLIAYDTV